MSVLEEYCRDPAEEVAETCQLAIYRLNWIKVKLFVVVDPDPNSYPDPDRIRIGSG